MDMNIQLTMSWKYHPRAHTVAHLDENRLKMTIQRRFRAILYEYKF